MANLAHTYKLEGRHDEAIELMESVGNLRTQKIGASHPHTLGVVNTLKIMVTQLKRVSDKR